MFGPVITGVKNFDKFDTFFRNQAFDAIKVVTGWPLRMAKTYGLTQNVFIRSTCGDPSNKQANPMLDVNEVLKEFFPWYEDKRNIYIQLGNEPNIDNVDPYVYWYYFLASCAAVNQLMPKAKIISPPLQFNGSESVWFTVYQQQVKKWGEFFNATYHYSGWNVYEDYSFANPTRHDVYKAQKYNKQYFNKPMIACEVGINQQGNNKRLDEYRNLTASFEAVLWFHYNDVDGNWAEYHIDN